MKTKRILSKEEFEKIMKATARIAKFSDFSLAKSAQDHFVKMTIILLGDDDRYWLCGMADAEQLMRAGYQSAD